MTEPETKICQNCKQNFTLAPEDIVMYQQAGIPPTVDCMSCTWKRLLGFWILGRFRVTESALSGKQIITMLPESVKFPIYEHEEFLSDAWDPFSYGQEYDP